MRIRAHIAEVEIPYSTSTYSIVCKSNPDPREADSKIHRSYQGWIVNLGRRINAHLAAS